MRKRILVGLLVLAVAGTCGYMLSQPEKGSVEWHKREYRSARRLFERTLYDRVTERFRYIVGIGPGADESQALYEKQLFHEAALLEMRFLVKRRIPVDPLDAGQVMRHMRASKEAIDGYAFATADLGAHGRMYVEFSAPAKDVPKWEELIRTAVVPEKGK